MLELAEACGEIAGARVLARTFRRLAEACGSFAEFARASPEFAETGRGPLEFAEFATAQLSKPGLVWIPGTGAGSPGGHRSLSELA
eukprot:2719573-Alexandrium_andersonii.AAC.1